jgi:hypothetical protein
VVRKAPSIDPFDSYSILKPAETAWLVPKQGRHRGLIAAVLLIVLAAVVGVAYTFGSLMDSKASLVDFAKASGKNESGKAATQQSKPAKPRAEVSGAVPAAPAAESNRKNEKQKRPARRSNNAHPKAPDVTPPPFSIYP